eukprot:m.151394 g.151394  ORF g.151394 m.151394 type:complete len:331 (-) comp24506_c0_seq1:41-1033(-)
MLLLALSTLALLSTTTSATGPCDLYNAGNSPCVAAHSTVRALYGTYAGPLYQVRRSSDNTTLDIAPLSPGGVANSAAQDKFCVGTDCVIQRIYDQSPRGNHLDTAPPGGHVHSPDKGTNATRNRITIGGRAVYGAYFEGGMGYRNDNTSGVATGDEAQSMYMVVAGDHYNGGCCFDYGNAETDNDDDGKGTMEALYFGNGTGRGGTGVGSGPWVMMDMEKGLWAGDQKISVNSTPVVSKFATVMGKGRPGGFTMKAGDAQGGPLKTMFNGGRPDGYEVMKKEGAIILGIGGDNSDLGIGTFYEGVMTQGFSSDEADATVHANVVGAGYGK